MWKVNMAALSSIKCKWQGSFFKYSFVPVRQWVNIYLQYQVLLEGNLARVINQSRGTHTASLWSATWNARFKKIIISFPLVGAWVSDVQYRVCPVQTQGEEHYTHSSLPLLLLLFVSAGLHISTFLLSFASVLQLSPSLSASFLFLARIPRYSCMNM